MSDNFEKTVLIVDDALTSRVVLRKIFSGQYEVLEAANGRTAIDILNSGADISAVLLDIVMPEMDGFAVLAAMQADERLKAIPVIVMTASTDDETQMKALSVGAMDVLYKPVNPQVTLKRTENLISRMDSVRLTERAKSMELVLREAETDIVSGLFNKNAFIRHASA